MSFRPFLWFSGLFPATLLLVLVSAGQTISKDSLAGMKWRLVGPFRGGRVEPVVGIPGNP